MGAQLTRVSLWRQVQHLDPVLPAVVKQQAHRRDDGVEVRLREQVQVLVEHRPDHVPQFRVLLHGEGDGVCARLALEEHIILQLSS